METKKIGSENELSVLLLHGWGGSHKSLESLQMLLSAKYSVTNIDLPGFGNMPLTKPSMNLDDYVEFLSELIISSKLNNLVLIGHSFGGKVAAKLAIEKPHLLEKLVLINASGINPRNNIKKNVLRSVSKLFGRIMSLPFLGKFYQSTRKLFYKLIVRESDYLTADKLAPTLRNILDENLNNELEKISCKTLLIWGEKDKYTPLWQGEIYHNKIKGSELKIIKEQGHNLPIVEPKLIVEPIINFLTSK